MARTYGQSTYGDSLYGVTNYVDGAATANPSATNSATADRIKFFSSSIQATSAVSSPTGDFLIDASANTIQATSSLASAAVEVFDGVASMGGSAVGSTVSGTRVREASATVSSSASNSASLQFVTNGEAATSVNSATQSSGLRIGESSATIAGGATNNFSANITANASSTLLQSASVAIIGIRVQFGSAQTIQSVSTTASTGREKWEPIVTTSTTWSTIAETSETWTKVA